MGSIKFEEEQYTVEHRASRESFRASEWLVRNGFVRDTRQAGYVLLGLATVILVGALYISWTSTVPAQHPQGLPPPPLGGRVQ